MELQWVGPTKFGFTKVSKHRGERGGTAVVRFHFPLLLLLPFALTLAHDFLPLTEKLRV
jgi:hypothetical protein